MAGYAADASGASFGPAPYDPGRYGAAYPEDLARGAAAAAARFRRRASAARYAAWIFRTASTRFLVFARFRL